MGELLIAAAVPAFRSKPPRWFRKNKKRIRRMGREQSFWERNTLLLSKEWGGGMRALTEKLVTLGYAVAPWPEKKGEFTIRGGTVIIAPINENHLYRVDFSGNAIDEIGVASGARNAIEQETARERKLFEYLESINPSKISFKVEKFYLKKSELTSEGPVYEDAAEFNLGK